MANMLSDPYTRAGLGQGLMSIGTGLVGMGLGGGPQSMIQGMQGFQRALDPATMQQRRLLAMQFKDAEDKRKRRQAWDERWSTAPSMVGGILPGDQPMLGGPLVDIPGGGTEPTQTQTAMLPPQGPQGMSLPLGVPPQLLQAMGPERGAAFLAQFYKPQAPLSAMGKLQADRAAGRISPEQYDQALAVMMKPTTQIKLPKEISETRQTLNAIDEARAKYAETGEDRYKRTADRLEMQLAFGGKPPESYIKARNSIQSAREGIGEAYNLIATGQADPLNFKDRAKVKQAFSKAQLAYADLLNRGANFTETEQAMIDAQLGGNPNDLAERALRGDESYLEGLRSAGEALERRGAGLLESFTTPGIGEYQYPWQRAQQPQEAPEAAAPVRVSSQAEYDKLPSGAQYIAPDGKTRIKK